MGEESSRKNEGERHRLEHRSGASLHHFNGLSSIETDGRPGGASLGLKRDLDVVGAIPPEALHLGEPPAAQAEYELVLADHPEHLAALFDLAVLKSDFLDQRKEALPLFEKYLALASKSDSHRETAQRYVEDIRMSQGGPK